MRLITTEAQRHREIEDGKDPRTSEWRTGVSPVKQWAVQDGRDARPPFWPSVLWFSDFA